MVFSSLLFIFLFLTATLSIYYIVPKKFRNTVLFIFSLIFYGYGEPKYIFLMLFSVLMNYIFGLIIGRENQSTKAKKIALVICVIINLSLLGFFKYATLFTETLKLLPFINFLTVPEIALPIGISFYTFQTMSYVIDVYRGNCKSQKNFITFGTYVALFPQLIAGPIVRYVDVEEQLIKRKESPQLFSSGVRLFLFGLAKKVLIANEMGVLWDTLKETPDKNGMIGSIVGIFAFTLQIYFDFSGYSDMACGLGNMFGFKFIKNFDYPYISKSITEFWRKWHISLGTWFREYVYIPLGGNRKGKPRQCLNIFIVWALTGFWHGASWNFLIWGLYFGVLLTFEKFVLSKIKDKIPDFIKHIYTMFFVIFGWIIFDFTKTNEMMIFIKSIFAPNMLISQNALSVILSRLFLFVPAIFLCLPAIGKIFRKIKTKKYYPVFEAVAAIIVLVLSVSSLVSSSYNPFLYFRF